MNRGAVRIGEDIIGAQRIDGNCVELRKGNWMVWAREVRRRRVRLWVSLNCVKGSSYSEWFFSARF
jgi:hypothetical protein